MMGETPSSAVQQTAYQEALDRYIDVDEDDIIRVERLLLSVCTGLLCFVPDSFFVGYRVFIGGFMVYSFLHPLFSEIGPSLILGVQIVVSQAQKILSHKPAILKQFDVFGQQPFLLTLRTPNHWVWRVCGELVNSRWAELYAPSHGTQNGQERVSPSVLLPL
jgi:hypothetical protein